MTKGIGGINGSDQRHHSIRARKTERLRPLGLKGQRRWQKCAAHCLKPDGGNKDSFDGWKVWCWNAGSAICSGAAQREPNLSGTHFGDVARERLLSRPGLQS